MEGQLGEHQQTGQEQGGAERSDQPESGSRLADCRAISGRWNHGGTGTVLSAGTTTTRTHWNYNNSITPRGPLGIPSLRATLSLSQYMNHS
jgi:hypothetical protein